jgi:uncharacterized protein with von Willebrand factor type A (vWA) domain
MFISFFYFLRSHDLHISINEWFGLMEALDQGLCNSLNDFYDLCRAILIKTEADYDKFDLCFSAYFKGVQIPDKIPDEFWRWLDRKVDEDFNQMPDADKNFIPQHTLEELKKMFEERLKEQTEEHHGGNRWIGTGGTSPFGHSGYHPGGIRIGGQSRRKSAIQVAGERNFKDFRKDTTLDIRSFQMAFRKLRELSSRVDSAKTELNIDTTVQKTCDNAGLLTLVWDRPRVNTIKLLIMMDSNGSMWPYSNLCNRLLQAVHKSDHFKDIRTFYFHNCIYEHLYTTPYCRKFEWIDTEWVMKNYGSDYRLILVGDASMAPSELMNAGGNIFYDQDNAIPGLVWLQNICRQYPRSVWLNPIPRNEWRSSFDSWTIRKIETVFPMFELTLDGLAQGIQKLKVSR